MKKTINKDNIDLEKTVLQHLTQEKTIKTKSVSCTNKDTVIINCMNEENILTCEYTRRKTIKQF